MDNCPECGYQRPSYNSCRNRHCPKCQMFSKERWIDAQKGSLLNVGYFPVVFTVPPPPTYTLHCSGRWSYPVEQMAAVLEKFFIPVKVLSRKFQGKLLALLKRQFPNIDPSLLSECYSKEWVVYCKPPFKDAACVVEYLGRYTHRVAISNNRILSTENGQVSFKWRDYRDGSRWKVMSLSAEEFIRRFLMHVLPTGFMKIRHYGFLSRRGKQKMLHICKVQTDTPLKGREKFSTEALIQKILGRKPSQCPSCGCCGLLRTGLAPPAAC